MGNVLAAGSPPPPPAAPPPLLPVPPGFGGPPPPVSALGPPPRPTEPGGDPLPNPGAFEECHRRCKELFPVQMEGVKLTVNKGLSNHFQVNHTVALSTLGESNYHFGATYVGTKQLSPTEAFPVLVGDMDNSGSLNAQVIHQLTARLRSKVAFQTQQAKFVNWQVDGEYRGADFTAAVTLGNPDILVGSGILVAHYLQSITPTLALGGELVYHRRPGEEGTVVSLAGRYTAPNWIGTLTVGQAGAHATYYHRANEQLQVGVEFEASTRLQDTSVAFGYQLELPKGNLLFRGATMKLWVVLVAVTLLAGCGAELSPPEPTPTPAPLRIWGVLGALEGAAANATARLRRVPLLQKLRSLVSELGSQASGLSAGLRAEAAEAWERAAEYGAEARAALELGWGEVKNRGATYGRKLRKRLHRDGEELRKRWDAYGHALGERAAALRRSWGEPWGPQEVED